MGDHETDRAPVVYRACSLSGARLRVREDLSPEWFASVLEASGSAPKHSRLDLPDGTPCHAKVYRPRPSHGILRRLRSRRAVREGRGYRAFRSVDLPVVPLLAYGERRRLGLLVHGYVFTEEIPAPTVAEAWRTSPDPDLLGRTARFLGRIHTSGLSHGDARTRNFLVTDHGLVAFDLASWSAARPRYRRKDVARLLAAVAALTGDRSSDSALIAAYRDAAPELGMRDEEVVELSKVPQKHPTRA
jgi:tRNA A-37 threonylcarbamoyl transferase component Bud32